MKEIIGNLDKTGIYKLTQLAQLTNLENHEDRIVTQPDTETTQSELKAKARNGSQTRENAQGIR